MRQSWSDNEVRQRGEKGESRNDRQGCSHEHQLLTVLTHETEWSKKHEIAFSSVRDSRRWLLDPSLGGSCRMRSPRAPVRPRTPGLVHPSNPKEGESDLQRVAIHRHCVSRIDAGHSSSDRDYRNLRLLRT